jgi:hypothetical protein
MTSSASAFIMTADPPHGYNIVDDLAQQLPGPMDRARSQSFAALKAELAGVTPRLEWQHNGSFAFLRNADVGAPLIRGFARPETVSAEKAARAFIDRHRGLFGLDQAGLATLVVDRNEVIGRTDYAKGVYYVSFIQKVNGIRVHQARVTFAVHVETGDLYSVTSNLFGAPKANARNFRLSPQQGVMKVLAAVGIQGGRLGRLERHGDEYKVRVESPDLDGPVTLHRSFLAVRPGELVPSYVALVWTKRQGLIEVGVDAGAGKHLWSNPLTSWYNYNISGWKDYPLSMSNQVTGPTLLNLTPDPNASPKGWLSAPGADGLYRTIGPNVITFYDWDGLYNDYTFDADRQRALTAAATKVTNPGTSSEVVTFDYTGQWATHDDPHTYVQLSMTENFERLNWLHDHYYKLGFTKAQGNFQDEDPVLVNAQDGADIGTENNANFSTPPDGTSGRMNMYVFSDDAGEYRDGTMDRIIFNHELGHGLHHRLTNFGDNALYGAQSGALGEGTADTFAFFREPFYTEQDDLFALAPYVAWDYFMYVQRGPAIIPVFGNFANDYEKPMGRFTDYSYDLGSEKITDVSAQRAFDDFGRLPIAWIHHGAFGNRNIGFYGTWSYIVNPESHSDGEIWAAATWRSRYRVAKQAWTSMTTSNRLLAFEQTMLMGLQLMPANPNFLQARDGYIIYEEMTQSESAACILKNEFARTGMGKNATAGVDGSYGAKTDYDEATDSFPLMVSDFNSWGCPEGTYNQATGDVTLIFSTPAREVEVKAKSSVHLVAATPGYSTKATITGPYVGTQTFQSSTDTIDKTLEFTPTTTGDITFTATVTSSKGESQSSSVSVKVVDPVDLKATGDYVEADVAQGDNDHYRIQIDHTGWTVGQQLAVKLHSVDNVDIDLYFNVDALALPETAIGYDADADGDESLTLQLTSTGWQVVNAAGTLFPLTPAGQDFGFYLDVAGFTASSYTLTLSRI